MIRLFTGDGLAGTGYFLTVGSGGSSVADGQAIPPLAAGLGIGWDWDAIEKVQRFSPVTLTL